MSVSAHSAAHSKESQADGTEPVPAGLGDRLVDRLRDQLHVPDRYLPIGPQTADGRLQVAHSVIVDIARQAAAATAGVYAVGASLEDQTFSVELVLTYGMSAPAVAALARSRVHHMLETTLGFRLATVDVQVVDVVARG